MQFTIIIKYLTAMAFIAAPALAAEAAGHKLQARESPASSVPAVAVLTTPAALPAAALDPAAHVKRTRAVANLRSPGLWL
ncbi:uncharacterized protein PgNI_12116 [Pyricularia grisea]|uniref:Uncharacterized protein n=1 Tax=Pyricularia grisea TaxID=148305 RepID=A0A6P8AQA2_PYRGI|nr:uncharacterized protein PgNI_12116 [Pyricularia grisea]TLD04214.1 hypothetical protein PgNI_12116 [Pyricularia grisea]